ncbi:MAG: pentapeptide repeat-containing protein [Tissierella sp.]|nr:pentapeptide repeat-containing protein [Tissierella sp.]
MRQRYYEAQEFEDLRFYGEVFENSRFVDCNFINCSFEDIKLINSQFIDCKFDKCLILNPKGEENSQIQSVDFMNCKLLGVNWKEVTSNDVFIDPINKIENSFLKYNTFFNMNLRKFDFSDNDIIESLFTECELGESKFKNCKLEKTEFLKSDLRKSDFRDAIGYEVDITSCKITGAKFSFPEAINLLNVLGVKID